MKKALLGIAVLAALLCLLLYPSEQRREPASFSPPSPSAPLEETEFVASSPGPASLAEPASATREEISTPQDAPLPLNRIDSQWCRVEGTVYDGNGLPASFVYVEALEEEGKIVVGATADENGRFALTLSDCSWLFAAGAEPETQTWMSRWPNWVRGERPDGFRIKSEGIRGSFGGRRILHTRSRNGPRTIQPLDGVEVRHLVNAEKQNFVEIRLRGICTRVDLINAVSNEPVREAPALQRRGEWDPEKKVETLSDMSRYANRKGALYFWNLETGQYRIDPIPSGYRSKAAWPLRFDAGTPRVTISLYPIAKLHWKPTAAQGAALPTFATIKRFRNEDGEVRWEHAFMNWDDGEIAWPQEEGNFTFRLEAEGYEPVEASISIPLSGDVTLSCELR